MSHEKRIIHCCGLDDAHAFHGISLGLRQSYGCRSTKEFGEVADGGVRMCL
jgi:hypothetical protein